MAKKYRDVLGMQLEMLVKCKAYNEQHEHNPNTRRASGAVVVDPKTGTRYKVVG